jgi:L-ascorbate metabolism protein UlaG (beta-lactamase superfamily)
MRKRRIAAGLALAAGGAGLVWATRDMPAAFGGQPEGQRAERVRRSAYYRDGKFHNSHPTTVGDLRGRDDDGSMLREFLKGGAERKPSAAIPLVAGDPGTATGELSITWYGHASSLVEIDGARVLFDPIWSDRCSPSQLVGPHRLHQVPIALDDLPHLDAIVISHDHYDHLDMATIRTLSRMQDAPFLVPLGVGAHLERWGVPGDRIIEVEWEEATSVGPLTLICTEAQHFSGRTVKRDGTLWSSWVVAGPHHKVFYTGDTGYFDGFAAIGAKHGPFDATLIQIGAYNKRWPDIHMTPEQGVAAHIDVRGGLMIPVHWGTFVLAFHPWGEPVDRAWAEAKARGASLAVPRPGERIDVADPPAVDGWWQALA